MASTRLSVAGVIFTYFAKANMSSPSNSCRPMTQLLVTVQALLLVCILDIGETRDLLGVKRPQINTSISAFFVFGDSTVDPGNNNYILSALKSNFPPYGRDFPGHIATGRFTNGRLVTDFIASYAGIKEFIPPYLDPSLSLEDLKTGVSFASAGTGFDPLTAQLNGVISIENQLKYFKEYLTRMENSIGKKRTKHLIRESGFLISAGTNDFVANYYVEPFRRQTYTVTGYQQFLLQLGQQLVQDLLELGARKIAFVGLPPIGCVPAAITLFSDNAFSHRGCIESLSSVARDYNRMLQDKLTATDSPRARTIYADIYKPLDDIIKNPQQFGFSKVNVGCCGSGLIEGAELCNTRCSACSDASKYAFWDSVHPTESAYHSIFQTLRPVIDGFLA